jgi:hypothetical protein
MPSRKSSSSATDSRTAERSTGPEVILDFRFEQGLLYIALINTSPVSAYRVSVRFEKAFRGLGGECEISSLRLFRRVEFLAPHKRIETLLDSSRAYFQRREPTLIKATISFRDANGKPQERKIVHDLKIYQDVSYLVTPETPSALSFPPRAPATVLGAPPTEESTYGHLKRRTLLQFQLPR